ncbi:MAG: hypothetical protein QE263_07395 [Vampirovibrionales bacterium]|nr:hypothetical protein [Vampirovibrionales bacterium]
MFISSMTPIPFGLKNTTLGNQATSQTANKKAAKIPFKKLPFLVGKAAREEGEPTKLQKEKIARGKKRAYRFYDSTTW